MINRIKLIYIFLFFIGFTHLRGQNILSDVQKAIDKKQYENVYATAKDFLNKDSTKLALKIFIMLQSAGYNNKDVYEGLGDAYSKLGVDELALTNYEQAEAVDSLNTALKFKSADLLYKQKKYTEAVNKYLKIISIEPSNAKAYLSAATIFYQAKLYKDASLMYEKYLALEKSLEAYQKITNALLEIKNYEKAYAFASEGLSKFPNNYTLMKNLALASYALKKFDESAKYYSSIHDSLLNISDYENAGRAFEQIKDDTNAIKYFEKVIQLDTSRSSIYMDLANILFKNQNYEQAVKYYKAKIKIEPDYELAYRFMGFSYIQLKNYDEARKALLNAAALNDTIVSTHYYLAQAYKGLDSLDLAADHYKKIINLAEHKENQYKDQFIEANYFLGQRAFNKKNYATAIIFLKNVLQFKPNDVGTLEMLGLSYHQLGNTEEAIRIYKRVKQLNPKSEVAKKGLRMLSAD